MKNVKKGLVVLLASLFVTSVFAAQTTTAANAKVAAATTQHAVTHVAAHKKACKKHCKKMHKKAVKKAVKKAEVTTPAKQG